MNLEAIKFREEWNSSFRSQSKAGKQSLNERERSYINIQQPKQLKETSSFRSKILDSKEEWNSDHKYLVCTVYTPCFY